MERVRAHEHDSVTGMLILMNRQFPELVNFAAVNRFGEFFASGRSFDPDRTPGVSHLELFKKLSRGDERAVMNPHVGPISRVKVTGVVVPIVDDQGRFDGLIGASIRFSALTDIIRAIIAMAWNMNIETVAEGVETEGQKNLLLD